MQNEIWVRSRLVWMYLVVALGMVFGGVVYGQGVGSGVATQVGDCLAICFLDGRDGVSREMEGVIEEAVLRGWVVRRVDMRVEPHVVQRWRVHSSPTTLLVRGGREVDRILGGVSLQEFTQRMLRASAADSLRPAREVVGMVRHQSAAHEIERGERGIDGLVPMVPIGSMAPVGRVAGEDSRASAQRATVRIIVDEPSHQAVGSGTIIDVQQGEALVITCGHLFRDMQPNSPISVEVFEDGKPVAYRGELIFHQIEEKDIGLIVFRPGRAVSVARVVSREERLQEGERVFSVGCDHGQVPSVRESRVTKLNRYLGAPNIETSGAPVQGRSGGGLFNSSGELVGVCYAADGDLDEGLYSGTEVVHEQVLKLGLGRLLDSTRVVVGGGPAKLKVQYVDGQGRVQQMQIENPSASLVEALETAAGSRSDSSIRNAGSADAGQARAMGLQGDSSKGFATR
jgi:S1-C subfamily serine protease